MNTTDTKNKSSRAARWLVLLLCTGGAMGGCAYGGMASTPDGTVLIARNGLFGGLRKIYACKVVGTTMTCVETTNAP